MLGQEARDDLAELRQAQAERETLRAALRPFAGLGRVVEATGYRPGAKFKAILDADECRRALEAYGPPE